MVPTRENRNRRASPNTEICSPSFWLVTLCLNWANTQYKSLYFPQVSHFILFVPQNYDSLLLLLAPRMVHFSNLKQKSFLLKFFWEDPWGSLINACLWASLLFCQASSLILTLQSSIEASSDGLTIVFLSKAVYTLLPYGCFIKIVFMAFTWLLFSYFTRISQKQVQIREIMCF